MDMINIKKESKKRTKSLKFTKIRQKTRSKGGYALFSWIFIKITDRMGFYIAPVSVDLPIKI